MDKTVYCYDSEGYYEYEDRAQENPLEPGEYLYPPNSTEEKPEVKDGYFCKWEDNSWKDVKIPTTPEEAVGIKVSNSTTTAHDFKMREVLMKLAAESSDYVLKRGDDLSMWIEKVPEPTAEELIARKMEEAKSERAASVEAIKVWVDGMEFDGDETAQTRMGRTITAAVSTGATSEDFTTWVLADNTVAQVTIGQLARALRKAGEKQTELWTKPYEEGKSE